MRLFALPLVLGESPVTSHQPSVCAFGWLLISSIKVTYEDSNGKVIKTIEGNEGDNLLLLAHEHDIDLEGEFAALGLGLGQAGAVLGCRRPSCRLATMAGPYRDCCSPRPRRSSGEPRS